MNSTPSANTRSRSARSKSPVPSRKSISPKPTNESPKTPTPTTTRSELIDFIKDNPNADSKDEFKSKFESYAQTPGIDVNDILLQMGALSCGANVKKKVKVCLIGEGGCGKTSLVNRLKGDGFTSNYSATMGASVTNILFWTSELHCFQIELWDCSGCEKMQGIGDGYFINSDGCLIMFDLLSNTTYKLLGERLESFRRVCPAAPVVILGNKADVNVKDRKVKPNKVRFHQKKNLPYFEVSVKFGRNLEAGFQTLVQTIAGDKNIKFVDRSLRSAEDKAVDVKRAAAVKLPEEDSEGL